VLSAEDFAAQQIGWTPKAVSIRRISSELNLNLKDFVFIDDRADQREMVKASVPEVQVLDAAANSTWEMLHWWALSLPEQSGHDRTQLYAERKQRETFLSNASDNFDQDTIFGALGLKVEFYVPGRKELRRVAELINRTNQFNTCASRTSVEQIAAQNESHEYQIIVANAKDKFGEMGIVSAMILNLTDDSLSIRTWVLSCRVFGYGIETAMLNYVRRIGQGLQIASLQGQIVETANNQPCRDVYADNGFVQMGAGWTTETSAISKDSSWLEVCSS
jgi:FkbH-like protein